MTNKQETTHARWAKDVAQLNEEFRDHSLYVSTVKVNISHGLAFLVFHTGQIPLTGICVAIRGLVTYEGETLRAGPHRFSVSERNAEESQAAVWILHSDDDSFRIEAEEIQYMREGQADT